MGETRDDMKPKASDSWVVFAGCYLVDDADFYCAICGAPFQIGQRVIEVPAGYGPPKAKVAVHLGCGINDNEVNVV